MPFILIVIGVILVVLNYKALKKDESSFSDVLKTERYDRSRSRDRSYKKRYS